MAWTVYEALVGREERFCVNPVYCEESVARENALPL
jgi:hypothetical protein